MTVSESFQMALCFLSLQALLEPLATCLRRSWGKTLMENQLICGPVVSIGPCTGLMVLLHVSPTVHVIKALPYGVQGESCHQNLVSSNSSCAKLLDLTGTPQRALLYIGLCTQVSYGKTIVWDWFESLHHSDPCWSGARGGQAETGQTELSPSGFSNLAPSSA